MAKRDVETDQYLGMLRRMVTAYGRRIASDPSDLVGALALAAELNARIAVAVHQLRDEWGYSWAEIARPLGITASAACQRWGPKVSA